MIAIIDYGMGNVSSIKNMLSKIKVNSIITNNINEILSSNAIILPGVGSFDIAMKNLGDLDIIPSLKQMIIEEGKPVLGICLGMQLMTKKSEEGQLPGLGWIDGEVKIFNDIDEKLNMKIPHMGWNSIVIKQDSPLLSGLEIRSRFYFVHSYHVICNAMENVLTETTYGYAFHSSFQHKNIVGVQFHPEKSHKFGIRFFMNFVDYFSCD